MGNLKNILITGSNGYIGNHLFNNLNISKYSIHKVLREEDFILSKTFNILDQFEDTSKSTNKLFFKTRPIIINCSSATPANINNVTSIFENNIIYTLALLKLASRVNARGIINLSSVEAYGVYRSDCSQDIIACLKEGDSFHEFTEYGASKKSSEIIFNNYSDTNNSWCINLRLPGVLGKGSWHRRNNFLSSLAYKLTNNEDISIIGGSQLFNNLIYISTLLECIESILESTNGHEVNLPRTLNLGSLKPLPLLDVINQLKSTLKSTSNLNFSGVFKDPFLLDTSLALSMPLPLVSTRRSVELFARSIVEDL